MLYLIYQKRIWSYCLEHINADIFTPLPLKSCLPHQQKKKKQFVNSKCHGYESWNSSAPLLPKRIFCHFGLKFFPWNEAAKVRPHLSDIIISSHVRSRTFYMCWSWFRTVWMRQERGSGVGGCRVLHSERDHRGCPTSFPIYSRANENTGKRHVPIS